VLGPLGELVGVGGDFVLQGFYCVAGFVEEDLAGRMRISFGGGGMGLFFVV
jgi:hypothetical protein